MTIYLNHFDHDVGDDRRTRSSRASPTRRTPGARTRSRATTAARPYLEIVPTLRRPRRRLPTAAWDARNSIIFRTASPGRSRASRGTTTPFEALAVTTVTARLDGHIVDADMEVNGVSQYAG